tara:strand:+ start:262 stop:471 length:210 start_codon:yes stop_codon:yes gene_type:complete
MANSKFIKLQKHSNNVEAGMLGFEKNGVIITNPDVDETGRFPVNYKDYYGLTKKQAEEMRKENCKSIPS